jgi:hypothetical protein
VATIHASTQLPASITPGARIELRAILENHTGAPVRVGYQVAIRHGERTWRSPVRIAPLLPSTQEVRGPTLSVPAGTPRTAFRVQWTVQDRGRARDQWAATVHVIR